MRTLSKYYTLKAGLLLDKLIHASTEEYKETFYCIGNELAVVLNKFMVNPGPTMLACASEDADWLAAGLLKDLSVKDPALAVFWNDRIYPSSRNNSIVASPIVKSYIEDIDDCRTLIIVKSIIATSCVVKTQLSRLIENINPENIFIVSPVMFKDAEKNLRNEFPLSISDKFHFISLVTDDEQNESGEVFPGIGGMVYARLGLGDLSHKNKYVPGIVKKRLAL